MPKPRKEAARTRARKVIERRPRSQGWDTTDEEEIERRRQRAAGEPLTVEALEPEHPAPCAAIRWPSSPSWPGSSRPRRRRSASASGSPEKLQRWLSCMRMLCDTPYILDSDCRICPKLPELEEILGEVLSDPHAKALVFSEWERMLELVRELAQEMGIGFAWHTGSVPQDRRRADIRRRCSAPGKTRCAPGWRPASSSRARSGARSWTEKRGSPRDLAFTSA